MASSLRCLGSYSRAVHRSVFRQIIKRFSTDALSGEYKSGEIGKVSSIPIEHLQRRVLTYSPARTASQKYQEKLESGKSILFPHRTRFVSLSRKFSTVTETQSQKLERIADELLNLTKLERNDYAVLLRYKMGLNNYNPSITGLGSSSSASAASARPGSDAKAAEKVVFDVKIEKFDAASKIKIIKEVRAFTNLGLKEAKDLVEKVPAVVKKGITKDEAESIMAKLKDLGATVVLE